MKKCIFLIMVFLLASAAAVFSAGTDESAATEVEEISFQVWVTPNLTRDFWDELVGAFEAENPDIEVKIVEANANVSPSSDDFIKTRLAAGDVPDLWWNVTVPVFADRGLLWELPADDPDLQRVKNLESALYEGKLYAFNATIQPQGLIYYNKSIFEEAGISEPPKSWSEFEQACAKLKSAGFTPIVTGGEWVAGYAFVTLTSPEVYHNNLDWYADRWDDNVRYTDDNYVEATRFFKRLVDNEYFNKGALSVAYPQLEQKFLAGEAAMYPMGSWFTAAEAKADKDFEVGVFLSPTRDGKQHLLQSLKYGGPGAIYVDSEHPEAAFELLKFAVMDEVYGTKFIEVDGLYSALDPPLRYDFTRLQEELWGLVQSAPTTSGLYNLKVGENPPPGLMAVYDRVGQALLSGDDDVERLLAQLDEFWDKAE